MTFRTSLLAENAARMSCKKEITIAESGITLATNLCSRVELWDRFFPRLPIVRRYRSRLKVHRGGSERDSDSWAERTRTIGYHGRCKGGLGLELEIRTLIHDICIPKSGDEQNQNVTLEDSFWSFINTGYCN